jgi:hypothetical protein
MDTTEAGMKTVIHVVSESPHAVVVQYPANVSTGVILLLAGLLLLIGGYASLYKHRAGLMHGARWLVWLWPLCGLLPMVAGVFAATTVITVEASVETGMLTVRHTVVGYLTKKEVYPLEDVQSIQLGFDRGCKFIYVELTDGSGPKILPCSPRTGYNQVAHAFNSFLDNQRAGNPSR